jgi:hypothetical protein
MIVVAHRAGQAASCNVSVSIANFSLESSGWNSNAEKSWNQSRIHQRWLMLLHSISTSPATAWQQFTTAADASRQLTVGASVMTSV